MTQQHTPVTWASLKGGVPVFISTILLLVTLATFVANLQAQVTYLDARVCIIEEDRRAADTLARINEARRAELQQAIEVRLAEIQRDIAYIRVELDKR